MSRLTSYGKDRVVTVELVSKDFRCGSMGCVCECLCVHVSYVVCTSVCVYVCMCISVRTTGVLQCMYRVYTVCACACIHVMWACVHVHKHILSQWRDMVLMDNVLSSLSSLNTNA